MLKHLLSLSNYADMLAFGNKVIYSPTPTGRERGEIASTLKFPAPIVKVEFTDFWGNDSLWAYIATDCDGKQYHVSAGFASFEEIKND